MRNGGEGRARLLLVVLIVTSLFLITLDLRGVKVLEGVKQGTQTVLSPFQRAGAVVLRPVGNFFSDVTHLGRTRGQIEKLEAENANLKIKLLNRKNAELKMLVMQQVRARFTSLKSQWQQRLVRVYQFTSQPETWL